MLGSICCLKSILHVRQKHTAYFLGKSLASILKPDRKFLIKWGLIHAATTIHLAYTAIPYRASTGPVQGQNRVFLVKFSTQGKSCFHYREPLFALQGSCFHYREWVCSVSEKDLFEGVPPTYLSANYAILSP